MPFKVRIPYTVVLVQLNEQADIVIPGGWAGVMQPELDMAVKAGFKDIDDALTLLEWAPAE
jgi:hypothetical protein